MSIFLAQNLVRQGKSVEEAAKEAGVGEEILRGMLGLPKKEVAPEPPLNRTKASKDEQKKQKIRVDSTSTQSPTEETKKEKKHKKKNLITQWCEKYPECFSRERPKPLKVGIHKDIISEMSDSSLEQEVCLALGKYVIKDLYLEAIKAGGARYDLEGKVSGEVSEENQRNAEQWVERRVKQKAERQKTE